ncbi:hypothetical protein PRZ48_014865 [Zasmidium cellare]|uniref:N-acetyltransferase domain-containing protein n=1 Tax=Zasmidium cellare TaxID=395010 RepID=A0ABR0DWX4_ZASCE|nr:hypothetical protein PRZ48_014865 [Zasmidium cellare]
MPVAITPATASDINDLTTLRRAAYATDALHALGLPTPMTPSQEEQYLNYQRSALEIRFTLPDHHYFKAVDLSTGRIVGFSCWNAPVKEEGEGPKMPELPAFVEKRVFDEIGERFKGAKGRIVDGREDYWYLQAMVVEPECQRQGIGDLLLKQGLRDLVDRDGRDCYLEASEAAARLYERNGFVAEEEIPIEVEGGTYTIRAMLRKAVR